MADDDQDPGTDTEEAPPEGRKTRRRGLRRSAPGSSAQAEAEPSGRGSRGPANRASDSEGRPGLTKLLWADIRGRRLPYQPTAEELEWEAEEEARLAASKPAVTDFSEDHYERMKRRYEAGSHARNN